MLLRAGVDPDPDHSLAQLIASDLVWSDPSPTAGMGHNMLRGVGQVFGPDVTEVSSRCNSTGCGTTDIALPLRGAVLHVQRDSPLTVQGVYQQGIHSKVQDVISSTGCTQACWCSLIRHICCWCCL